MAIFNVEDKITENPFFKNLFFDNYFSKDPIGFIDVGARGGSHSLVEPLHTHVSFLGFEPDQEECDALNNDATLKKYWNEFAVLPQALADTHGKRVLNIISSATNTSLLEPNEIFINRYNMAQKWTVTRKIDLNTAPLDYVMYDSGLGFKNSGEIIKLDTQGTEYEIMLGAKKLLTEKTLCVVTEVEFFPVYKDQKLFSDVEIYLRSLGFSFYGFMTQHTRSKKSLNKRTHLGRERLFYADAIFFKDPLSTKVSLSERQYYILLFSAILTGYFDFALELSTAGSMNLSAKDQELVRELINSMAFVDPQQTASQLGSLAREVEKNKENGNIFLGKFIDAICFPDFEDVRVG